MAEITKDTYLRLLENRPFKFSVQDVNYREGEGETRCRACVHFFERKVDQFSVCEIMRPDEEANENVFPNFVCDFYTSDGEDFPLLPE